MAIATEIYCDGCGDTLHYNGCVGKNLMQRLARKNGWSIGKYDLCPKCKSNRNHLIKNGWLKR